MFWPLSRWFHRGWLAHFGACHVGIEVVNGRCILDVSMQYWTLARIEIDWETALQMNAYYIEAQTAMRRADGRLQRMRAAHVQAAAPTAVAEPTEKSRDDEVP
jgi:hypothetical protein